MCGICDIWCACGCCVLRSWEKGDVGCVPPSRRGVLCVICSWLATFVVGGGGGLWKVQVTDRLSDGFESIFLIYEFMPRVLLLLAGREVREVHVHGAADLALSRGRRWRRRRRWGGLQRLSL